jgi:hypothetical protein
MDRAGLQVDRFHEAGEEFQLFGIRNIVIADEDRHGPHGRGVQTVGPDLRIGEAVVIDDMVLMKMGVDNEIDPCSRK